VPFDFAVTICMRISDPCIVCSLFLGSLQFHELNLCDIASYFFVHTSPALNAAHKLLEINLGPFNSIVIRLPSLFRDVFSQHLAINQATTC
jgi:hypothetical protein